MYFGNVYSGFFLGLPRPRFWVPASTDAGWTFFGLPGRRFGAVSTGFSFLGLPGLLFGGCSVGIAVEPFKESVVGVVPERFSFLGRPRLDFIAIVCSGVGDSSSFFAFGLPLFTNVMSGFTWYAFWLKATFIRANRSVSSRFV